KIDQMRDALAKILEAIGWGPDLGFDQAMSGLVRGTTRLTRALQSGSMEIYVATVFIALAISLMTGLIRAEELPQIPSMPDLFIYEWAIIIICTIGLFSVLFAKNRLTAIVSLGIQGFAVALIFLLLGAPDLGFTQFMVETLSVVILALVMTKLHLDQRDNRVFEEVIRDGGLALICGIGLTTLLLAVLRTDLDTTLTDFFIQTSVPIAHGRNIVNVILVDYRALDTLGEISVVMTAGIAILALIRLRAGGPKRGIGAIKRAAGQRAKRAASKARSAS
uniref:hydrogen gas-evolving membrane-bound hydrogenase subunit E n=1 Tax=uncultured Maritalea sp. TaxID=757249 RepID=UPI0026309325